MAVKLQMKYRKMMLKKGKSVPKRNMNLLRESLVLKTATSYDGIEERAMNLMLAFLRKSYTRSSLIC